jgi:hypothetical protein
VFSPPSSSQLLSAKSTPQKVHTTWCSRLMLVISLNQVVQHRAIQAIKDHGDTIDENLLQHLSPLGWEHINLTGDYVWRNLDPCDRSPRLSVLYIPFREATPSLNANAVTSAVTLQMIRRSSLHAIGRSFAVRDPPGTGHAQ